MDFGRCPLAIFFLDSFIGIRMKTPRNSRSIPIPPKIPPKGPQRLPNPPSNNRHISFFCSSNSHHNHYIKFDQIEETARYLNNPLLNIKQNQRGQPLSNLNLKMKTRIAGSRRVPENYSISLLIDPP